ncbi:MAG: membrane protein insertase YidC [Clostridia bacterium]|nr:membrane protein insertase YidC [Clostridia bacterium]
MDFLSIALTKPNGFWDAIIFGMESSIGNYALALILVTVIIKFIMVPFDFINKYTSKKSSRKQMEMKPELDKVNAKYANDKNLQNQKTMEVYKAHNYNVMGTCLGMLLYMVFTMIVFWTLFGSLNNISSYKIGDQYLQVRKEYFAEFSVDVDSLEEQSALDAYKVAIEGMAEDELATLTASANEKANAKYQDTKTGFLWIENIWLADSTVSPVMKYSDFIKKSKISSEQVTEEEYNLIMNPISSNERKVNGYFILAILAAGINYLSININNWISKAKAKKKGVDPSLMSNGSGKWMSIIMPIIMGVFTLFYNAAFGLYIVAGALIALLTGPLVTMFADMLEIEAIKKEQLRTVAPYDRKRRK